MCTIQSLGPTTRTTHGSLRIAYHPFQGHYNGELCIPVEHLPHLTEFPFCCVLPPHGKRQAQDDSAMAVGLWLEGDGGDLEVPWGVLFCIIIPCQYLRKSCLDLVESMSSWTRQISSGVRPVGCPPLFDRQSDCLRRPWLSAVHWYMPCSQSRRCTAKGCRRDIRNIGIKIHVWIGVDHFLLPLPR